MKTALRFFAVILGIFALQAPVAATTGCVACSEAQWGYVGSDFSRYDALGETHMTPGGINYDPSGLPINPELIDRLTNEVDACLVKAGYPSVIRSSFVVKVASDYILEPEECVDPSWGQQQLLPVNAPDAGCIAKKMTPTTQCPCMWRAAISCPNHIITTPSFFLYKDALIRFTTHIDNVWASAELAKCAQPTTSQLSDGTEP